MQSRFKSAARGKMAAPEKMNGRERMLDRRKKIREAIRQAAIDEFAQKGLAGASTQSIAQRAGLTKPQLHYYISSKEELYEEVLVHINDLWRDIFIASSGDTKDPAKVIRDYVRNKLEFGRRHPNASRVFSNEVAAGGHYLQKHWHSARESTQVAAEIIQSWVDKKLIKPVDPWLFQMHIWAVTQHYADYEAQIRFMLQLKDGEEIDMDHVVDEVSTLFLRACGLK